jgi:hypothetical protein
MPDPNNSNRDPVPPIERNEDLPRGGAAATQSAAVPVAQPRNFPLGVVFLGPNGLRAGWRLSLFLFIAASLYLLLAGLIQHFAPRPQGGAGTTPAGMLFDEGLPFLAAWLSAAVMARLEKRSLADYALPGRSAFGRGFWQGVVWGFVALTLLLLMIRAAHDFDFGAAALSGTSLLSYAAIWAIAFLGVGFCEEFLFRGYALYTLTTGMGFWPSAVLLSALFGAMHLGNAGESRVGVLMAGLIGLFFCFTVRRTGSLWFAIGLHAMWDYSESFIYSVPDSGAMVKGHLLNSSFHGPDWITGGSVGPEGSWLVFVIIAAMFVVFDRLHRDVRFPLPESSQSSVFSSQASVVVVRSQL